MISILLILLNAYRAMFGAPPLAETPLLDTVAQQRCGMQVAQGGLSHDGLPQGLGENLAMGFGNEQDVMRAWENSPGHADNMRLPYYREVGLARCERGTWVQVFGLGDRRMVRQGWVSVAAD